jgi:UDP-N-acetylglucosamine acyltransferase
VTQSIHPTAIVDPSASIAADVIIGPYAIIGPQVTIGKGSRIESHAVVKGPSIIGEDCHIFQFATVGEATPDLKYQGEETWLKMGDRNVVREGATIHRGTIQDLGETRIGSDNLIMAYAHVGHDCVIGNHCILVNNSSLAGHVWVGDWAILGGYTLVHQRVKIGAHAFTGFGTGVSMDVPAFVTASGHRAEPKGINSEGLKRRGYTAEQIANITKAYKLLYRRKLKLDEALVQIRAIDPDCEELGLFISSISSSTRGIMR